MKKFFTYPVFVVLFLSFIGAIGFGGLLKYHYEGGERFQFLQNVAVTIAEVPYKIRFVIKNTRFAESYQKINAVNFSMLVDSIKEITTPEGDKVSDRKQIADFIDNCDAKTTSDIEKKLSELRMQSQIKPVQIKATDEQIKKGVSATYDVPVTFDNSNFFG